MSMLSTGKTLDRYKVECQAGRVKKLGDGTNIGWQRITSHRNSGRCTKAKFGFRAFLPVAGSKRHALDV